mmetsp:Transcript_5450/g.11604  ORF Transcript_5450/g.11604 Transcript_5450/m.11604 type:complete len:222 (+) Transcript_5450:1127-1792(+)
MERCSRPPLVACCSRANSALDKVASGLSFPHRMQSPRRKPGQGGHVPAMDAPLGPAAALEASRDRARLGIAFAGPLSRGLPPLLATVAPLLLAAPLFLFRFGRLNDGRLNPPGPSPWPAAAASCPAASRFGLSEMTMTPSCLPIGLSGITTASSCLPGAAPTPSSRPPSTPTTTGAVVVVASAFSAAASAQPSTSPSSNSSSSSFSSSRRNQSSPSAMTLS